MDTAYHSRPRRLVLLVFTFLALLAQPAAWAEGVVRKVGVVTIVGRDAAIRSPLWKILTDVARSTAPDSNITFEFRSAEGNNDRYPQIVNDLVEQRADVIFAGPGAAAIAGPEGDHRGPGRVRDRSQSGSTRPNQEPRETRNEHDRPV
jgi:ABC-type uncharacterized transport system substrate-binding protein